MDRPVTPRSERPRLVTLSAPVGRWTAGKGDLDLDPRDSGLKLQVPLILN